MKHLKPVNEKARRLIAAVDSLPESARPEGRAYADAGPTVGPTFRSGVSDEETLVDAEPPRDVVALHRQVPQQPAGPHIPLGCSTIFAPGWEVDRTGGTAGLCQPVERDLFDCHLGCFWPAQVPDQLNHAPDWTKKCAAAQKDWRKIDLIFP
jgi:Quinohemoprotein amine dehydrogenase, gamma subunit